MLDILYAMMVPSGCDASAELAYLVGEGDSSRFVDMMNALRFSTQPFSSQQGLQFPLTVLTLLLS